MKNCPNTSCQNHTGTPKNWYVKNGYYKPKSTNQKTPRYQCKACKKNFSTHTGLNSVNQKKPKINQELFKLLVSGVSLRRASQILGVEYNTVVAHFNYLADVVRIEHYLHARAKPLSVPLVVRVKTGEILGFSVAKMPAKGLLSQIGVDKYKWYDDERSKKFQSMLVGIKHCFAPNITFKCDNNTSYNKWITNQVPNTKLEQITAGKKKTKRDGDKDFDPLFFINNTFARMRHDMNRLARKTWSTTKAIHGLENHIWLYIAWNNKYKIK